MSKNRRQGTPRVAAEGFNISRHTKDIEFPFQFRREFDEAYTYHQLYSIGRRAITLVSRTEVIDLISKSGPARRMPFDSVVDLVFEGVGAASNEVSVAPQTLVFKKPNISGNRKIAVLVDDGEILRSERNEYLRILSKLCRAKMPRSNFRPEVYIGQTTNAVDPCINALQALAPYIPDRLTLERAKPFPVPKSWQQQD